MFMPSPRLADDAIPSMSYSAIAKLIWPSLTSNAAQAHVLFYVAMPWKRVTESTAAESPKPRRYTHPATFMCRCFMLYP